MPAQQISITTSQYVSIDYVPAGFYSRLLAFFLDLMVMLAWTILNVFLWKNFFDSGEIYLWFTVIPVISVYTLIMEYFMNGQTPGKRVVGIRVVMLNGTEPGFFEFFVRWCLRLLEIYLSSGVLATLMISTTRYHQRLADLIAGTVVIRVNRGQVMKIEDLDRITTSEEYQPVYPGVVSLPEDYLLLIKQVVDRAAAFNNEAHGRLLNETAMNVARQLDVQPDRQTAEQFLKTVIRDYVVMTR